MLQDLAILHRRKPRVITGLDAPVWATCLRSLAFVTPQSRIEPGDEFYVGARAYEFLLEIVCGLHSPIVGETEVMGQFKRFAVEWTSVQPERRPLVQRLLADAKELRTRHLANLGVQSYGSWLRKNLAVSRVHVVGAGHLAGEILPYLEKRGEVVLHARRAVESHLETFLLADRAFDEGALVIAAPLAAREVANWLAGRRPAQIFDLRETAPLDPIPGAVGLDRIFADITSTRSRLIPVLEVLRREIRDRGRRAATLEKVRPLGWDDLCA